MSVLVLFGAGASHGSEPEEGHVTPPLGNNLFRELYKLGGVASKLPQDIRDAFDDNFEAGMEIFNKRFSLWFHRFHRELSSYLADFTPSSESYYVHILKLFLGRDVVFSSLNYDMMLEEAILGLGLNFNYSLEKNDNSIRILKPHGSINFWSEAPPEMFQNCVALNCTVDFSSPVKPVDRVSAKRRCGVDTSFSPAMSMYAKGKRVRVCPDFVVRQQNMFSNACGAASKIIIVGVRVVPEDSHIWGEILNGDAQIIYFGSKQDKLELDCFVKNNERDNVVFIEGFFDKAVSEIKNFI